VDPEIADDVIVGCVQQYGEQSWNIGRNAWLQAGLPVSVPATTLDRQCGSSQQAVSFGTSLIASGVAEVVVCAGVEHMGHVPLNVGFEWKDQVGDPYPPELRAHHDVVPQGISAELVADRWEVTRAEMDELALRSHQLADRATNEGRFVNEIILVNGEDGDEARDQGIRPSTTLEALAGLRPVFRDDGRVTAGNSSQISDGASAVLLMSRSRADSLGIRGRAEIVDHIAVGVDPVLMLTGPVPATQRLLDRNGMDLSDVDLIEINEAFAAVVAMWRRELKPDMDRVNVNGGAIALGHPLGASGTRLITTLLNELERSDKEIGLSTMCCGGGIGTGTLIRRV
jgi:acetyl-CoA acetyltransferase family protein